MIMNELYAKILQFVFVSSFLISLSNAFNFREISSSCFPTTINTASTYLFSYFRTSDNYGTQTAWSTSAVLSTATIRLIFPSDYTLTGSETCNSVTVDSQLKSGATCAISGNTITVSGAFTGLSGTALNIQQVDLSIGSVLNPSPAKTTGQFSGYIGTDYAVPYGSGITLTAGSFASCKIVFDPTTVRTSGKMVLTLDPTNQIPSSGGQIKVNFPISRLWSKQIVSTNTQNITTSMSCSAITTNVITPTCAGSVSAATVTFSNFLLTGISDSFQVSINNLQSPPTTQPADFLSITSYDNSYQLDKCTVSISDLTAKTFTSFTITSIGTMTVNTNVGLRFFMTLADIIDEQDYFQITFPTGLTIVVANATSTNPNINVPSKSGQVITITQKNIARQYSQGSTFFINFYNFTAPPSTKVTDAITLTILRNNYAKMTGTATVQAVASTLSGSVSPTVTTVATNTSYVFTITINDPLSSTGMIKITFPTQLSISTSSTSCAVMTGSGTGVNNLPTCTINSADRSITLSSLSASSSTISAQTLTITISGIINADSIKKTDSFTVNSYYQSTTDTLVATGTITGVTATMGIISASSVTVSSTSYICLDSTVTYTIGFVSTYKIPANGYIELTIPNKITVVIGSVGSYCKFSVNGGSYNGAVCTGTTESTQYRVKFNGVANSAIAAGSTISLQILSIITNPSSTAIVSSFGLYTYAYDGSSGYGIESLATGIIIQMTTAAAFTNKLVERASDTNSATTTYTFKLTQKAALQTGAYVVITFPSVIEVTSSATCTDLSSNSLTCSISTSQVIAQLASAVSTLTQFGIIVTNVINPPSYKPLSDSFTFRTKTSDDISKYAQSTYLTALSNNIASVFSTISGTFSPQTYGSSLTLTISLKPSSRIVPTKIIVSLASSFSVTTAICSSFVGFTGSCTSNSYTVEVTGTLISSTMSFSIQGITAPTAAVTDYTIVSSYDSSNYKIDDSSTNIIFSVICTLPCKTCTSGVPTQCLTCYNSTISTFVYYYSTDKKCYDQCPSKTYEENTLYKCLACDSICLQCDTISTNCTSCVSSSSYPYLNVTSSKLGTCLSACTTGYYPDSTQSPTKCVLCESPCSTCSSKTVCLSCVSNYYYNGSACVTSCPLGTTIQNTNTWTCDSCNSVCATCSITVNNCTSCSSSAALYNGDCVSVCPSPLVINNGACASCDTSCLTCSLSSTNCTSCNSSVATYAFLYNNKCISICPQTYYKDTVNAICKLCSALTSLHCVNCSSSSTCLSCDSGYVLFSGSCLTAAPAGYVNMSGVAVACTGDCQTCSVLTGNCTSCTTNNLEGNNCVATCSAGSVPINQICTACTSPCKECSVTLTNCTTCLPNLTPQVYFSNYDCVQTCPTFTYPDNNTNICENCVSPCQKCTSATQCTSCLSTFFLFGTECNSTCPFGYIGISRVCTACTGNCQSCQNSTSSCLTCNTNFYYLSTTKTCQSSCPTGLYPDNTTGTCSGCTGNCATCENTSSTCLTCTTGNLYKNDCITTCPDSTYALNSKCQTCNTSCQKCTSASVCTACQYGYYLYLTFCVNPCPTSYPVISSSGTCQACSDNNCVTCNSSDYCSSCVYPNLLFVGTCVSSCPTNYTANDTSCNYNPVTNNTNTTTDTNTTVNETLTNTLSSSSSSIVPVPFFIGGILVSVAAILSKLQYSPTFLFGALFSIWALLEWGSLVCALLITYFHYGMTDFKFYILAGAFGGFYVLNIIALLVQNCFLRFDVLFNKWLEAKTNFLSYLINSLVSLFINHKFKNLLFCKLFNFNVFKAPLQSTQSFRIFNLFSFLHFVPAAASITGCTLYIIQYPVINQPLMAYIDLIALSLSGIILAFFNAFKGQDFFFEVTDQGYVMNKRIIESESIIQQAILPQTNHDEECYNPPTQTPFKKGFHTPSEISVSSIDLYKNYHNISIQAEQIIEKSFQQSMIDHYSHHESVPDVNYFEKHDVSAQYDISKKFQDKSISMQPIRQQQISIQFSPRQQSISIQNSAIQQNDISLQHVPNQQQNQVQANVQVQDISAQYSQKPVFENIQQDFLSETEQNIDMNESATKSAVPVRQQPKLRPELELDIDQKLKKRQQQLQMLQQENRKLQREMARKKFQDKFSAPRESEQLKKQQSFSEIANKEKLNNMFNNQSNREQSSLMDSKEDLLAGLKNKKDHNRVQTVKSQQEFLDLLTDNNQKNKVQIQQKSISLNVSGDLNPLPEEQSEPPKNNIIFQQEDKQRLDQQQLQDQDQSSALKPEDIENIIKGDSTDSYLPSFDKSNSTNFISTRKGRTGRPPLRKQSNKNFDSSLDKSGLEEDEEIIRHPIRSKYDKEQLKRSRQSDIDHETRNNLNDFLTRKNKNPFSAHPFKKDKDKSGERNYSKQQALPQMERLKSQQSLGRPDRQSQESYYKSNSRKIQYDKFGNEKPQNFQFYEDQRIQILPSEENKRGLQDDKRLPRIGTDKRFNSTSKYKNSEKPVHRQLLNSNSAKKLSELDRYISKQEKKANNVKNQMQTMQYMLSRPNKSNEKNKGYMRQTYTSQEKKKNFEKIYLNKPKRYE